MLQELTAIIFNEISNNMPTTMKQPKSKIDPEATFSKLTFDKNLTPQQINISKKQLVEKYLLTTFSKQSYNVEQMNILPNECN